MQVPLFLILNGERTEIGMASVGKDGSIIAQVKKDIRLDLAATLTTPIEVTLVVQKPTVAVVKER